MQIELSEESVLSIIMKRLEVLQPYLAKEVLKPQIVEAKIIDEAKVMEYVKSLHPGLTVTNLKVSGQNLQFEVSGTYYCQHFLAKYKIMYNGWSPVQTEKYDTERTIESPESLFIPITSDIPGLYVKIL